MGGANQLVGEVLDGKYRVDSPLGSGGMGTVYVATHLGTGREVALKVLAPELTANDAAVERFRREARAAGQMRHPNVVDVTDFGFADRGEERIAYLVMELLRGRTLRAVLEAEGRLPLDAAVDVLSQVCAAVTEAHGLGILHRDLKPENVHLEAVGRGYRVKVLDFGIAKLLRGGGSVAPPAIHAVAALPAVDASFAATLPAEGVEPGTRMASGSGEGSLTKLGAAIGTPRYMSPEQWLGQGVDARADVYSLGIMAYEMLAGVPPFEGKGRSIAIEHAEAAPPNLTGKAPGVPAGVATVVEAALAKEPARRPASAAAFAAGLQVAAETPGKLLRRSIGLCADHYGLLLRRYALVTVPPIALAALCSVSGLLARVGALGAGVDAAIAGTSTAIIVLSTVLVAPPVAGLAVPVVADLLASRPSPRPSAPLVEVWTALGRSIPSSLVSTAVGVIPGILVAWLTAFLARAGTIDPASWVAFAVVLLGSALTAATQTPFAVTGPVVAMERAKGLAPLRRSMTLIRPMWRAAFGVQFFYGVLTSVLLKVLLPWLEEAVGKLQEGAHASRASWLLVWIAMGAASPFVFVPFAILYLRVREAEGKPLAPA